MTFILLSWLHYIPNWLCGYAPRAQAMTKNFPDNFARERVVAGNGLRELCLPRSGMGNTPEPIDPTKLMDIDEQEGLCEDMPDATPKEI
jgi:hypothetical protein